LGASSDVDLLARVVRNPGRLVLAPLSSSAAFPYQGTPLGLTRGGKVFLDVRYQENRDPASGAIQEIARRWVEFPRLVFLVEGPGWDEDVLASAFASTTVSSAATYPPETRANGTIFPSVVRASAPILFAADDPKGKSVYFKRPLVIFQFGESVPLSLREKAGLPIVIIPTPHQGTSKVNPFWQIGRLGSLAL
jgi:hypothetical protein